jgi:hypothetical protein
VWFCSGVVWAALSHAEMSALIIASLNFAQGIFVFLCARRMENLRSYQMVVLGCVLAMLPCYSPVFLIGLPVGIWALVVLFRPEVRAAFSRGPISAPPILTPGASASAQGRAPKNVCNHHRLGDVSVYPRRAAHLSPLGRAASLGSCARRHLDGRQ